MSISKDNVFIKHAKFDWDFFNPNKNTSLGMGLQQGLSMAIQPALNNPLMKFIKTTSNYFNQPSEATIGMRGPLQGQTLHNI